MRARRGRMLGARLPNLAALRLGERDDDDGGDEADIGAPTPWPGDLRLGTGPPGGTPNVFDSTAWMQATANINFDPSAPRGEYVKLMDKMVSFAYDQLDVIPKYVFLVDGENVWRAHTGGGGSERCRRGAGRCQGSSAAKRACRARTQHVSSNNDGASSPAARGSAAQAADTSVRYVSPSWSVNP